MKLKTLAIAVAFIWCGMLLGISFLEAPLKFQAPNVTLGLGLGIGRLVFFALNKFELIFALILLIVFVTKKDTGKFAAVSFAVVVGLLLLQTFWLLPLLDARAELVISGASAPFSMMHYYYIAAEVIKLILVFGIGWGLTRRLAQ